MVLMSSGVGAVIEFWKVLKMIDVEVEWANTYYIRGVPIRCPFIFSYSDSVETSATRGPCTARSRDPDRVHAHRYSANDDTVTIMMKPLCRLR